MTQTSKRSREARIRACCDEFDRLLHPDFFKALCDANRCAMLIQLARRCEPCTVTEVAEASTVDVSVVSRHLKVLREAGLLDSEKRGREVLYRVRYSEIVKRLRGLADAIEACCPEGEESEGCK